MKNILLITTTHQDTISYCAYNLYRILNEIEGVKVFVYSTTPVSNIYYPFDNVINKENEVSKFRYFSHVKNLRKLKIEYNIDLAISTQTALNGYNLFSSRGEKKVGIYHSNAFQLFDGGIIKAIIPFLLSYATIFLSNIFFSKIWTVSEEAQRFINSSTVLKDKNEIVYNVHFFDDIISKSKEELPDILKNEKYFLFVGKLYYIKGWDRLLRAFSEFLKDCRDYKLVFCGAFPNEEIRKDFSELIKKLNLTSNIILLGFRSNPYNIMSHSQALISSSYSESLPGVIIESLSLKVPVIATNSSIGIWEILSAKERYDKRLKKSIELYDGIICPNEDKKYDRDRMTPNQDELELAKSMKQLSFNRKVPSFEFKKQCIGEETKKKVLELLF